MKPPVLIVANIHKSNVKTVAEACIEEVERIGMEPYLVSPCYTKRDQRDLLTDFDPSYRHKNYEFIVVVGGDGTFLYTARTFLEFDIPIIGVNVGRLGFLMEVNPEDIRKAFSRVIEGEIALKRRMLLQADLFRGGKKAYSFPFLNDAVVSRGSLSRMIEIEVLLAEGDLTRYRADGLIVSTPTGSTAYNLAAGGPILTPDMEAMIITPICPHILGVRPIVTSTEENLTVRFLSGEEDTTLTMDGQEAIYLKPGDYVVVRPSGKSVRILDFGEKQFFRVLGNKLGWQL